MEHREQHRRDAAASVAQREKIRELEPAYHGKMPGRMRGGHGIGWFNAMQRVQGAKSSG